MERGKSSFTLVLVLLLIIALGASAKLYRENLTLKENPQKIVQEEVTKLVDRVSKLIVLPAEEIPTIATVQDPEKLKDQAFFINAKVGDKVLIYTKARKAVLYDPVGNKIVEVAPVNIGDSAGTAQPAAAPSE